MAMRAAIEALHTEVFSKATAITHLTGQLSQARRAASEEQKKTKARIKELQSRIAQLERSHEEHRANADKLRGARDRIRELELRVSELEAENVQLKAGIRSQEASRQSVDALRKDLTDTRFKLGVQSKLTERMRSELMTIREQARKMVEAANDAASQLAPMGCEPMHSALNSLLVDSHRHQSLFRVVFRHLLVPIPVTAHCRLFNCEGAGEAPDIGALEKTDSAQSLPFVSGGSELWRQIRRRVSLMFGVDHWDMSYIGIHGLMLMVHVALSDEGFADRDALPERVLERKILSMLWGRRAEEEAISPPPPEHCLTQLAARLATEMESSALSDGPWSRECVVSDEEVAALTVEDRTALELRGIYLFVGRAVSGVLRYCHAPMWKENSWLVVSYNMIELVSNMEGRASTFEAISKTHDPDELRMLTCLPDPFEGQGDMREALRSLYGPRVAGMFGCLELSDAEDVVRNRMFMRFVTQMALSMPHVAILDSCAKTRMGEVAGHIASRADKISNRLIEEAASLATAIHEAVPVQCADTSFADLLARTVVNVRYPTLYPPTDLKSDIVIDSMLTDDGVHPDDLPTLALEVLRQSRFNVHITVGQDLDLRSIDLSDFPPADNMATNFFQVGYHRVHMMGFVVHVFGCILREHTCIVSLEKIMRGLAQLYRCAIGKAVGLQEPVFGLRHAASVNFWTNAEDHNDMMHSVVGATHFALYQHQVMCPWKVAE